MGEERSSAGSVQRHRDRDWETRVGERSKLRIPQLRAIRPGGGIGFTEFYSTSRDCTASIEALSQFGSRRRQVPSIHYAISTPTVV